MLSSAGFCCLQAWELTCARVVQISTFLEGRAKWRFRLSLVLLMSSCCVGSWALLAYTCCCPCWVGGKVSSLLTDEREAVQKKTFTKWVNSHLARVSCRITDLYTDLRDGRMLIKLLEVLSGERLVSNY